jgi:hypothetical protein
VSPINGPSDSRQIAKALEVAHYSQQSIPSRERNL